MKSPTKDEIARVEAYQAEIARKKRLGEKKERERKKEEGKQKIRDEYNSYVGKEITAVKVTFADTSYVEVDYFELWVGEDLFVTVRNDMYDTSVHAEIGSQYI